MFHHSVRSTPLVLAVAISGSILSDSPRSPGPGGGGPPPLVPAPGVVYEALPASVRAAHGILNGEETEKHPNQPDRAAEFFRRQRLPRGASEVPMEHLWNRLQEIEQREAVLEGQRGASPPGDIHAWRGIGPGNIGGRTRAIAIDPTDPSRMFAAGVAGGIFRSTNGGASWRPVDDLMLNLAVCSLVIDPQDPNIMYAGTGEGYGNSIFVRGLGIFKSTDAGLSWAQLPSTSTAEASGAFYYVNKIVISPNDSNRLFAGTAHGVFKSTDAGASWDIQLANPWANATPPTTNGCSLGCLDIAVRSDRNPEVVFAAFGSFQKDGLFRSDDGGASWTETVTPFYQGRMTIGIAPSDNDRVYVGMADNGSLAQLGRLADFWRADDGETFQSVLDFDHEFSPWLFSYISIATGCLTGYPIYSQGWYDQFVAVDPVDPDIVFVGGINVLRSDDAGNTFGLAGYWTGRLEEPPSPTYIHADQHTAVFHPDYDGVTNQTLFVGNDGGLWKTTNARAATSQEECPFGEDPGPAPELQWESLVNGYAVTQFYHGDAAKEIDRFVGGAQDNGSSGVVGTYELDDWQEVFGGDGGYVAIDPTNADRFFVEIQGFPTIEMTTDGGVTFAPATNGITDTDGLFITPYAMDQSDPNVMWTGGRRPWRTTDGAAQWYAIGPNLASADRISAIGIAPTDGNVVYLGFNNGYVARTPNGLSPAPAWSLVSTGLPLGAWVSSVAVDPHDPNVAYATYSTIGVDHIYRTTNGGSSWASIDGISATGVPDIPVHWLAIRPTNSQQLYAGTEFGVFTSDDGGSAWFPANLGLAHTVVETLDFQDDDTLVAFTFGRGTFVTDLGVDPTDAPVVAGSGSGLQLAVAPSPFRDEGTIRADLPAAGHVRLSVHDVTGRAVTVLVDGPRPAGRLVEVWNGRDRSGARVATGAYFARLEASGEVATKKLVVLR